MPDQDRPHSPDARDELLHEFARRFAEDVLNTDVGASAEETQSLQDAKNPAGAALPRGEGLPTEIPSRIGPYRILHPLGQGGMGVVYLAEQEKPIHRRVALKIVKPGMDSKQVIARFETEREALALMNHPNVAKVFDAGATEIGRPYFVMEYVPGVPITEYCDKHRLNTRERLDLFMDVCNAVQHAHQKGIIHRDIKPSNVLVAVQDDKPVVKVIDFGVAKATQHRLTDQTLFTEQGQLIGTPGYMSPEQAEMTALDIDTRTDIYSLGVLLYEVLVGELPFDTNSLRAAGLAEIQRIIREVDPPKPSTRFSSLGAASTTIAQKRHTEPRTLARQLRGDLDWIVMKCLEKDRTRRYDTANGLALDIKRYLNNEPVLAGPPSTAYRLRKFIRRNRVPVIALSAVGLALFLGVVGTTAMYLRAAEAERQQRIERERAEAGESKAIAEAHQAQKAKAKAERTTSFMADILKGAGPSVALGRDSTMLREILEQASRRIDEGELAGVPEAEVQLRMTIGATFHELGEYNRARKLLEPVPSLARSVFGSNHRDVAAALLHLAGLHNSNFEIEESEHLSREALAMYRKLHGDEHADVANALMHLAQALINESADERSRLIREALAIRRKLLGADHADVAEALVSLATVLGKKGDLDESGRLLHEAMVINRKRFGHVHPNVSSNLVALASQLAAKHDYDGAEHHFREALDIQRKLFGNQHPAVAWTLSYLANVLGDKGNYEEAESSHREALAMFQSLLGTEHATVYFGYHSLADLLEMRGELDQAERVRRMLFERLRNGGVQDLGATPDFMNLVRLLGKKGNYYEAEALCRETLAQARLLGDENPAVFLSLRTLAELFTQKGDYVGAERVYREEAAIVTKALGVEHPATIACLYSLAEVVRKKGDYDEAEALFVKTLDAQRRVLGEEHPDVAESLRGLAYVLVKLGRFAEAETYCLRAEAIWKSKVPPEHRDRRLNDNLLGTVLASQGRFAEAQSLLLISYEALMDDAGVPSRDKRQLLERLARFYESWDRAEPGKGHGEKAAEWRAKLDESGTEAWRHEGKKRNNDEGTPGKGEEETSEREFVETPEP